VHPTILALNAGSSSVKFQLFAIAGDQLERELKGQVDGIGVKPRLVATGAAGDTLVDRALEGAAGADLPGALASLGGWLREHLDGALPVAFGHRVVHGGPDFARAVLIDDAAIAALERLVPLAPLHQPNNLTPIKAVRELLPGVPQVACFDTAFHRSHGELADRYALPEPLYAEGVRRYGFHGLSYEYIARTLPDVAPEVAGGRVVAAHLGSGASLCAMRGGRSVDSTMGFTALDGLPMGTRPGAIDPGVVLYLIERKGMDLDSVTRMLYHDCGLKGLSGISNDVRELVASDAPGARLALEYFAYRIAKEVAALASVLEGLDALVFTAGIGENSPRVRSDVCRRLAWLGVALDEDANARGENRISHESSALAVHVVPTDEERMIALHTLACVGQAGG
jgi:acetate kinase